VSRPTKIAIVTGASSGIGEATALAMARGGYHVVAVARREALLESLVARITASGGSSSYVAADLADEDATRRIVGHALDGYGHVDVLVNNAGYGPPFALEQMSRTSVRHAFDVNLFGGMQLIAELTPSMRARGRGRIINVSSVAKSVAAPFATVYAGTKGALDAMTDCLRLELGPFGISLSLVIPGFVDTPTFDTAKAASKDVRADPANPYRATMDALETFADAQLEKTGIPAERVGTLITSIADARSPRARYYVPGSARFAAVLFGALPDALADRILRTMYGLP